jgi:hypothetical protein
MQPPSFKVPAGFATQNIIDGILADAYTAKTWTGKEQLASDGANMPVIGASRITGFHNWDHEDGSFSPLDPLSPPYGRTDPLWAVQNYPIVLPRELILVCDQVVFDTFAAAHLTDLLNARIFLNSYGSSRLSPGSPEGPDFSGGDITDTGSYFPVWPNLLYLVPSQGVQTVAIEQANVNFGGGTGYTAINRPCGTTTANAFIGGQRLVIVAADVSYAISTAQASYGCFYDNTGSGSVNTYQQRTALTVAHKARVLQTDPYWDKISRVYHLCYTQAGDASMAAPFIADFITLANSCGNCTIVNQGNVSVAAALTAGQIWSSYVKPFFGL